MRTGSASLLFAVLLAHCGSPDGDEPTRRTGIDTTFLDNTVSPCSDFYQYACGTWIREHPLDGIPYDLRTMQTSVRNSVLIGKIIEDDAANRAFLNHADADKVGAYYRSCFGACQSPSVPRGFPYVPGIAGATSTPETLAQTVAQSHLAGAGPFFVLYAATDPANPGRRILTFSEASFSLPHRDYYLDPALSVDAEYTGHITKMKALLGTSVSIGDPSGVLALERSLAAGTLTDAEWDDPRATYNPMAYSDFVAAAPHFAWNSYVAALGLAQPVEINVLSPKYLATLDAVLAGASAAQLTDYLYWTLVEAHADAMGKNVTAEESRFHWGVFYGDPTPYEPALQCEVAARAAFPYAIAQPFVQTVFAPDQKARVTAMVTKVKAALQGSLSAQSWLDEPTRAAALEKLAAIVEKVGYPSAWPSYADVLVNGATYLDDQVLLSRYFYQKNLGSLASPVDRTAWGMSPITDNASYSPMRNDITLPAAFLQPPHYVTAYGDAYNYGAVGTVIGHELTHAFDTSGRMFDATGALRDWWTEAVAAQLTARAACVVDQYSQYEAAPGIPVDGVTTAGENIADLGGVRAAYAAYKALGESETFASGFNADQEFFVSYAQLWCSNIGTEAAQLWATVNVHSPPSARVNGVVSNMSEFAAAFACPAGTPMVRSPRCEVW